MLTSWNKNAAPLVRLLGGELLNELSNSGLNSSLVMKVDVIENPNEFVIHADLPGINKEDIVLEYKDSILSVSVEMKKEREEKEDEKFWVMERSYSKKSRTFQFGVPIDEANIKAKYESGVLTLVLPKTVLIEPKKTQIKID